MFSGQNPGILIPYDSFGAQESDFWHVLLGDTDIKD